MKSRSLSRPFLTLIIPESVAATSRASAKKDRF